MLLLFSPGRWSLPPRAFLERINGLLVKNVVLVKTPLRLSLVGGGADLEPHASRFGWCVMSGALRLYTYVMIKRRHDDEVWVNYSKKEKAIHATKVENGVVREALLTAGIEYGVEVTLLSDVADGGSGLSSSSSFAVGLVTACADIVGSHLASTKADHAALARSIEHKAHGAYAGGQDHLPCVWGGFRRYSGGASVGRDGPIPWIADELVRNGCLVFSGIHRSASKILESQTKGMEAHEAEYKEMTAIAQILSQRTKPEDIVDALFHYWTLKKKVAPVPMGENLREQERRLMENFHAVKLCGAGGGGTWLCYAPRGNSIPSILRGGTVCGLKAIPIEWSAYGSTVVYSE